MSPLIYFHGIMLTDIIIFAIVLIGNAFAIIGFNRACQYEEADVKPGFVPQPVVVESSKMIFWRVKYYSEMYLGEFWSKPVYSCPTCMASLHGVIPFMVTATMTTEFGWTTAAYWAFYTLALSGVATYINER